MSWWDVNGSCATEAARRDRKDGDLELVEALRRHDSTAAERLVAEYGDRAYRFASSITGHGPEAEEIVQEACVDVIDHIETLSADSTFRSWFYGIVADGTYEKLRSRPHRQNHLRLDDVLPLFDNAGRHARPITDWSSRVDDPAMQADVRRALTAAIGALPELERIVLLLCDVERLSHVEVAQAVGLSIPAVKSRLHRARLFLRTRLSDLRWDAAVSQDERVKENPAPRSTNGARRTSDG